MWHLNQTSQKLLLIQNKNRYLNIIIEFLKFKKFNTLNNEKLILNFIGII